MSDVAPHNMTNNTTPSPFVASASSQYLDMAPYRAFDGGVASGQYWLTDGTATGWLKIYLGSANQYIIAKYDIQINTVPENDRAPKDWTLQGSVDDSAWDVLDTVTGEVDWSSGEKREFVCDIADTSYRYFKLVITANNGSSYLQIAEVFLWETPPFHLSGTIKEKGIPVVRTVRSYVRSTGVLYSSGQSNPDGTFNILAPNGSTKMFVIAFDDDIGDQYNALIFDRIIGVPD